MVYSRLVLESRVSSGRRVVVKEKKAMVNVTPEYYRAWTDSTSRSKGGDEILTGSFARVVPLLLRIATSPDLAESRQFHRQSGSDASQYITDLFNLQTRLARFANIQMAPLMEPSFHCHTSTGLASKCYNGSERSKRDIHLLLTHSM